MRFSSRITWTAAAALAFTAACDDSSPSAPDDDLVTQVRQETARFSALSAASAAGYHMEDECVAHPDLGGMGHHAVNGPLIDGAFEPLQPEVMLYEPSGNGSFELIGVEYIVVAPPGTDLEGNARPHFDGHPFDIGGVPPLTADGVPHWSLHVWVHKANTAGMFVPFNPAVSCGTAAADVHRH